MPRLRKLASDTLTGIPPCAFVDNFVFDKDILVCAVYTEYLDHSVRFMSLFEGCGLMSQVSQQCIVIVSKTALFVQGV